MAPLGDNEPPGDATRGGGGGDAPAPPLQDDAISPYDELVARMIAEPIDPHAFADVVERQDAADAADTLEALQDEAADVLVEMEARAAADALAEMEQPLAVRVVEDLVDEDNVGYAAKLLGLMASDDAVDLLQAMDEPHRERLLGGMPSTQAAKLRRMIGYEQESAAGMMTTDFPALRDDMNVAQATDVVRRQIVPETFQYLPVVDAAGKLVGVIGLRDLLLNKPQQRIADAMDRAVDSVRADMDREAVAREFDRYDYVMMPVVDEAGHLLGIVTVDDVIDIIRREQTEDVQKTVGAGAGEAVYSGLGEKFRGRFPWLGASLVMTCLAAAVVLMFEDLIARRPFLAFLLPVIAALVGNAGHQALAVTLRGIVLDEVRPERVFPLVVREALIGLINGVVLGALMFVGVWVMSSFVAAASWELGMVSGLAAAIAMSVGTLAGSSIPLLMKRLGADPAQSSAIFLIMITDAVSFTTLLALTLLLVRVEL